MADRELEEYQAEKERQRERKAQPAKALSEKDLSDAERRRLGRGGEQHDRVPPDARGQAERGRVDQVGTDKNWTQTR